MADLTPSIAVLGSGSWGTALALLLARNGLPVTLWGHLPAEIETLKAERENRLYLPGVPFPETLQPEAELSKALANATDVLVVVPSHAFRAVLQMANPFLSPDCGIGWATKGFDPQNHQLLHEVATEVLGSRNLAAISGPTFAGEVANGLPTAITIASSAQAYASSWADYLKADTFRAYTSDDIIGVQVGGATKNVMAIAAGIADGLGFGANTRAALITRGLAEIMRLGTVLGAKPETFMGLAGIGDLALTCTDNQSRNRRMGLALARGLTVEQAKQEIGQEVEGINTTAEVYALSRKLQVDMPITHQAYRVIYEGLDPLEAVQNLLGRQQKAETG